MFAIFFGIVAEIEDYFKGGSDSKVIMITFYPFTKSSTRIDLPQKHKLCSEWEQTE